LAEAVKGKEISVLVNNVGTCKLAKMSEATVEDTMRMINVNVNS
jgi:short-subunit dehydrogenase